MGFSVTGLINFIASGPVVGQETWLVCLRVMAFALVCGVLVFAMTCQERDAGWHRAISNQRCLEASHQA